MVERKKTKKPFSIRANPGDKLKYTYGATINMGNYNSDRVEFGMEITIRKGEDPLEVFTEMVKTVESVIEVKVNRLMKQLQSTD